MSKNGDMVLSKKNKKNRDFFDVVSNVENVYIPRKVNKERKMFTFVRFKSKMEAQIVVQKMNGISFNGSKLEMNVARYKGKMNGI